MPDFDALREDYKHAVLDESGADPDPFAQFHLWFEQAIASGLREPNAMTLATVSPDGSPSARIVLLKAVSGGGFTFFTNYASQKGIELAANPRAALVFYWNELERQVRINGSVERVSRAEAEEYFHTRPLLSRIGAIASHQSTVIPNRHWLEERMAALEAQYAEQTPPMPQDWGGYRLTPVSFEFWQGRRSRLHDRIQYRKLDSAPLPQWIRERLSP